MGLSFIGGKQSKAYSSDFNSIDHAIQNAVLTGCEVTVSSPLAMAVKVESGKVFFGNDTISVSNSTITISNSDVTNDRIDLIAVNVSGVVSVLKGTAASIPLPVDYNADDYIIIARILVKAGVSTITISTITDTRIINSGQRAGVVSSSMTTVGSSDLFTFLGGHLTAAETQISNIHIFSPASMSGIIEVWGRD